MQIRHPSKYPRVPAVPLEEPVCLSAFHEREQVQVPGFPSRVTFLPADALSDSPSHQYSSDPEASEKRKWVRYSSTRITL